jgi:hypothetical protein
VQFGGAFCLSACKASGSWQSAALDQMGERLLDANRTIGQPNRIAVIFGRKVTKQSTGKLQTLIKDIDLPNP